MGQFWPAKPLHSGTEQTLTQRQREQPRRAARSSGECQAVMTKQFGEKIALTTVLCGSGQKTNKKIPNPGVVKL